MDYLKIYKNQGFDDSLSHRNSKILEQASGTLKERKTGTTIVGCVFPGGIVLGADTRATSGSTVFDKNCAKLHKLAPNIYCAGAGTAADTEHVTLGVAAQLELLRLNTNRPSRVETAKTRLINHLFRYGGYIGAYLIVGGYDPTGPWLYNISADGSSHHNPYLTMGSGSLAAMSVFEANYRDNFTKDEAVECAIKAIESGIRNDLGSGSNVDIVVIDGNGTDYQRNVRVYNQKAYQGSIRYEFPSGTSSVINTYNLVVNDAMDIDS